MVRCATCGTENASGRRFCDECGAVLETPCPTCGQPNRPGAKFCGDCGTTLADDRAGQAAAALAPPVPSIDSPDGRGRAAERRLVTVLFADLVGFTPFAEERDPEAVRDLLTRYFDGARLAVERHGGSVEKFIGDAVMAVWGTPVAHEDDAERAVRAAFEIVETVTELGAGIEARAGVMTGEAAVTLVAAGQGMVAGDLVNTAARLQSIAPPSGILVGEATMHAASAAIAFDEGGVKELKGKAAPVRVWRALRVVAQRGGHRRADALEPPFVGRDDELRILKDALHATGRDRSVRLVSVSGPAGIGKSRLAWELEKYVDGVVEQVYWHRGRSPSYGEGIAFWALGEMVRRRAGLAETDDEATTRSRIAEVAIEYVPSEDDRRWVEPALLALLGLEPPPAGGRDALFAGWRIFFESVARRGTTVLLFEDLQWADAGLLEFIDHLRDWSRGAPLLLITLARPELFERRPEWGTAVRHLTTVALEPLSVASMHSLLDGFVPGLPDPTVRAILERADGIPLYAVETVRMLVAQGQLERAGEAYRATGDLTELSIPETLRSLIGARLDALEAADRTLLQDASVLGRTFSASTLASITGISEAELETRLRLLVRREILQLEADPRSPERGQYSFVQSLIREVAYDTLARGDRRARHLAAARHFEGAGDDELAGVLASHYLAAYNSSAEGPEAAALANQARLALRGAAERAAALGGHDQAMRYLDQALALTDRAAERADLQERAAESADTAGRYGQGIELARNAAVAYREAGDDEGLARVSALLGVILIDSGDLPEAVQTLETALRDLPPEAPDAIRARILTNLSRALFRSGENQRSVDAADLALSLAEPLNLDAVIADAFLNKGGGLLYLGRRREALSLDESALRIAVAGGFTDTELRARNNTAVALFRDEMGRALEILRGGSDLALRVGNRSTGAWLAATTAFFAYLAGDGWDQALESVSEALSWPTSVSERCRLLATSALIRTARGDEAQSAIDAVNAAGTGVTEPNARSYWEAARSQYALLEGDLTEAYRAAIRASEEPVAALPACVLPLAVRAALWQGDARSVEAAVQRLLADPFGDAFIEAERRWASAITAGSGGDRATALQGFSDARRRMNAIGADFQAALFALDAVVVLGADEAELGDAVEEARATFERLGAARYLERLETVGRSESARDSGPVAASVPRAP